MSARCPLVRAVTVAVAIAALAPSCGAGVEVFKLDTGAKVLVQAEVGGPLVGISVVVRTTVGDDANSAGARAVCAQALFGGSAYLDAESVSRSIAVAGGSLEVRCEPDYIAIVCVITPDRFEDASYVISQALKNAEMDEDTARKAVAWTEAAVGVADRDPAQVAYAALRSAMYADSRYRLPLAGVSAPPIRVTRQALLDFFHRYFTPSRTVVSVAGGVRVEDVRRILQVQLRLYDRRSDAGAASSLPSPPEQLAEPVRVTRRRDVHTAVVMRGYPGPGMRQKDFAAFSVMGAIIGGGKGSRLFRRVRDSGAIGYTVEAVVPPLALGSHLVAHVEFDPSRVGPDGKPVDVAIVERDVNEVVLSLLSEPATGAELQRAARYLEGKHLLAHERVRDRAFNVGLYEALGLGYEFDEEWPRALAAVTVDDVTRVATTYLTNGVTAVVLPER